MTPYKVTLSPPPYRAHGRPVGRTDTDSVYIRAETHYDREQAQRMSRQSAEDYSAD